MKKPNGTLFHFEKSFRRIKPLLIIALFVFFISCEESVSLEHSENNDLPEKNDAADDHHYEWERLGNEWKITLKPESVFPPDLLWSIHLYYSWTGTDDALPLELTIQQNSFDFFPKAMINAPHGYRETALVFHRERWGELPREITVRVKGEAGGEFTVLDIMLLFRPPGSDPLAADPGTMLHYPHSLWRNEEYETFSHNLYPGLLYLVSDSFTVQSRFLKRLAFFTEKTGFVGRLAKDEEISHLRDWFAHDYRSGDLAAFYDLARRQNFPLNEYELVLRELLLKQGIIRAESGSYVKGEGALLGFSIQSGNRLPVYYVHETVHGLEFIIPELQKVFLDFFDTLSSYEKDFMRDALLYRGYNVLEDRQLLAS